MKKGKIIAIFMISVGLLTGCVDNMPDMTQEENDLVAEYAADLLLKYSPNYNNRLVDVDSLPIETVVEETMQEESEEIQTQDTEENNNKDPKNEQTEQPEKETEIVQEEEKNLRDVDVADILSVDDLSITFNDYQLCDMYPVDGTAFGVSAAKEHKLLVLHFEVKNAKDEAVLCDMFEIDPKLVVTVNGKSYKAMNTLLENDMTVYIDEIKGDSQKDLVALFEIETDDEIGESFILQISNESYYVD